MDRRLKALALAAVLAGGAGGWYLFRPERAFIDHEVRDIGPLGGAVVRSGEFEGRTHRGRGLAEIVELPGGRRVLRLSRFDVLNGPDLQVYLLADPAASGRRGLRAGYASLGALKGNVGDQFYEIPADLDLSRYRAVAVWCRRFGVNFATATLGPPAARARGGPTR